MTDHEHNAPDYADRLTDQALQEIVGGKRPPDLADKVVAASSADPAPGLRPKSHGRVRWTLLAVAASLLVAAGVGALLIPGVFHIETFDVASRDGVRAESGDYASNQEAGESGSPAERDREINYYGQGARDHSADTPPAADPPASETPPRPDMQGAVREAPSELYSSATGTPSGPVPGTVDGQPSTRRLREELHSIGKITAAGEALNKRLPPGGVNDVVVPDGSVGGEVRDSDDADEGRGAGQGGDRYARIYDNPFLEVEHDPLSTFSIDVDTASYAKIRRYLLQNGVLPPPDAVRIEELVNYFPYSYEPPTGEHPFAVHTEVAGCPWQTDHRLIRIGLKGREIDRDKRPASNLVFLIDVSGSMRPADKLPRVKAAFQRMVQNLGENDRVAVVVYAGAAGLVLPSTTCDQQATLLASLEALQSGGSTAGAQGINLAYQVALDNFIPGGTNRVLLCTDGDFNVGVTSNAELVRLVEEKAKQKIFLSVLGFGMGNHNDEMLEQIADKGNGNYAYIDSDREADKVLIEQMGGTLVTIAKDVKIQIEFNPAQVAAYRLIGYENRLLAARDFNDDTKDAGEIGAGHTVTALYELVPAGKQVDTPPVDDLKYQKPSRLTDEAASEELLTVKLRYKQPDGDTSTKLEHPVKDPGQGFDRASEDFLFASSVAAFGMLLRDSPHKGYASWEAVEEIARSALGDDPGGYRAEFLDLVKKARQVSGK